MLNGVFWKLAEMSLRGGAVVLAVVLARLLLRKAPKRIVFCLWAAVLLRLLCPITVHFPAALLPDGELLPAATAAPAPVYAETAAPAAYTASLTENAAAPGENAAASDENAAAPAVMQEPIEPVPPVVTAPARRGILPVLWLIGCGLLLIYSAASSILLRRRLRESVEVGNWVRMADGLDSPFVLGLLRPVIYLPSDLPESVRQPILRHEQAHVQRLDPLWKRLGWLALCLHWFNPLVWLAFFLASRDMEMACDERVLSESAGDIRADYSELLLKLTTGRYALAAPLAFGEGDTGPRVKNIMKWKKPKAWIVAVAALVCVIVVTICVAERKTPKTVWEREVPEFRTTLRVQWDGKKYSVNHTRIEKLPNGASAEPIRFERPVEDADGILLTGVRNYYDEAQNRMTHDALTLYLLTPENIKELRDAEWEQTGIRFEVRVLDGEALLILAIQQAGVRSEEMDVREIGLLLASGGEPGEKELSASKYRPLTDEEIRRANDLFDWMLQHIDVEQSIHAVLRCYFDSPAELPLESFLRYLPDGGEKLQGTEYQEEVELVNSRCHSTRIDSSEPVYRFPAEQVNVSLQSYLDITVDDLILPYREMSWYLPETDAFYIPDSGIGMDNFCCEGGETDGETVRLYLRFIAKKANAGEYFSILTLEQKAADKWYIVANQPVNERGVVQSAVPAGEWKFELSPEQMEELFESREALPLDELMRFLLKADGACAEGGAAELYDRFTNRPTELVRYLLTLGNLTVPEHPDKTAAQAACELLAAEGAWFGDEAAFEGSLMRCAAVFPEGRGKALTDCLREAYQRLGKTPQPTPQPTPEPTPKPTPEPTPEPVATSITLNRSDFTLIQIGETYTVTATVSPSGSGAVITWSSDDPDVAAVDANGKVTAVGRGTAIITASAGGVRAECTVRVNANGISGGRSDGLSLSHENVTIDSGSGESFTLSVKNLPAGASVSYRSDNEQAASVDAGGVVKAAGPGTATVTATVTSGGDTRTLICTVRVK